LAIQQPRIGQSDGWDSDGRPDPPTRCPTWDGNAAGVCLSSRKASPPHSGDGDVARPGQMNSARSRSSADFGLAPTISLTTCPSLKTLMVGIFMIP
jgi:hypothetical protein